jgi:hypothetical protein
MPLTLFRFRKIFIWFFLSPWCFKLRFLWRHSIIPAGVDHHYTEGFTVSVLENESPGCNCHGIDSKTNQLFGTSLSGNDSECTASRPGWENMGRKGKGNTRAQLK